MSSRTTATRSAAARRLREAEAGLFDSLGRPPTEAEVAAELNVPESLLPRLRHVAGARLPRRRLQGLRRRPTRRGRGELAYVRTHGVGVHRFDMDDRYAYISTEMEGYVGNILVVYDIADPARPAEVSRWWMPGQHVAGGETPHWTRPAATACTTRCASATSCGRRSGTPACG